MFHVVLHQPEIPPNTGNIIRLCANTGCQLHLIRPLGFSLEDRQLIRAGLDYHEFAKLRVYDSLTECLESLLHHNSSSGGGANVSLRELVATRRVFALTTKGAQPFYDVSYQAGDIFLFGAESCGLPPEVLVHFADGNRLRLPMQPYSRSLNLSNTAAVVVYEAWRQCGFI